MKKLLLCLLIALPYIHASQGSFAASSNIYAQQNLQRLTPDHKAFLAEYVNTLINASRVQDRTLLDAFAFINGLLYGGQVSATQRIATLCQIMADIGIQLDACSTQPASFDPMDTSD